MKKPRISVRLSKEVQGLLNRQVARITSNPILLGISQDYVNWGGRAK